jgi:DNA-binding IclR family transcriptional regulator
MITACIRQASPPDTRGMLSHDVWSPDRTINLGPLVSTEEPGQGPNLAKSAIRALDVLELFGELRRPLRAVEINSYLELSPSSANQLLKTMVDGAYLIFDPVTKRYFPSPRLALFGGLLSASYFPDAALGALKKAVRAAAGETVVILAAQGTSMQILDVDQPAGRVGRYGMRSREPRRIPKGLRAPLFGSAAGTAWLSTRSDAEVLQWMRRARRQLGPNADAELILAGVRRAREQGYAFGGISKDDGVWTMATPLPVSPAGVVLILSVAGPAERMNAKREMLAGLVASMVAEHLGGAGASPE